MRTARLHLTAILGAVSTLFTACTGDATRGRSLCAEASNCWTVQFAFTSFTGQRAELDIDGDLVLDESLSTANWSTAHSRSLAHPVSTATTMKLRIDGAVVYEGRIAGRQIRTIYVDPRSSPILRQTDHPGPLLD